MGAQRGERAMAEGQGLIVGLRHSCALVVDDRMTPPALAGVFGSFVDIPPVFATAFLVAMVEWASVECVRPRLDHGLRTVGTLVELTHLAATPIGMKVTAEVELIAVAGRKLRFRATCRDERDLIGEGFHERAIIDPERFLAKVAGKGG
jgi:fluoroacetyl-CoA thioesterase